MKKLIVFISTFLLAVELIASAVSFKAELSHSKVAVGQRFRITFTVNAAGGNFTAPRFDNFRVLSGPNQSNQMQYVNGKVSRQYSISYILVGTKVGKFEIGPAVIVSDGDKIESNTVEIEVVEELSGNAAQNQRDAQRNQAADELGKYVFIKAFIDKKSAYVGEKMTLTYKLYTRLGMRSLNLEKLPDFTGFWTSDLMKDQPRLETEYINGEVYQTAVINQYLLYPQRAGKLTIDPLSMNAVVQVRGRNSRSAFEAFFGSYETKELTLNSPSIAVDIKALPKYSGEGEFSGAVGKFDVKISSNKQDLKANEAIDLRYEISGNGNLPLIGAPDLSFPPDLEAYDPETTNKFSSSTGGSSGKKLFNYLLIPRHKGKYVIEPHAFTYFDLESKRYKTLYTDSLAFDVKKGDEEVNVVYESNRRKEDVEILENDIRFIHLNQLSLLDQSESFCGSAAFYICILVLLLLVVLLYFISKKYKAQQSDIVGRRKSRAKKLAKKRLSKALKFKDAGEDSAFYQEIGDALYGYYADRYNMGMADLSIEVLLEKLKSEGASDELLKMLKECVEQVDIARYAPGSALATEELYKNALNIIEQTEALG